MSHPTFSGVNFFLLFSQLERYKELKEIVRRKVATLTQQLEKLWWEQKADQERVKLNRRKKKEVEVLVSNLYQARITFKEKNVLILYLCLWFKCLYKYVKCFIANP